MVELSQPEYINLSLPQWLTLCPYSVWAMPRQTLGEIKPLYKKQFKTLKTHISHSVRKVLVIFYGDVFVSIKAILLEMSCIDLNSKTFNCQPPVAEFLSVIQKFNC